MVEAAGIEPAQSENPNPLMARDFYSKRFAGLPFAIPPQSPAVLPNPLLSSSVVEVFWRRAGKFPAPHVSRSRAMSLGNFSYLATTSFRVSTYSPEIKR